MRVLHWDVSFSAGGGVANAVRALAHGQARLGAEVGIAAVKNPGPPMYEPMGGDGMVSLLEWEPRWTFQLRGIRLRGLPAEARRRLRAFKPDVVHVHGGFNPDNLWVPRVYDCAVVFSPHGSYHPEVFRKGHAAAKHLYLFLERGLLHRRIDGFHALSPMEREQIARLVPGGRVYCVPQGPGIQAELPAAPGPVGGDRSETRLVFVGRLDVFTKGLDLLLEAFAEAARRLNGHPVTLTLAGPGWRGGAERLQRQAQELGIADRTILTGPLSSAGVASTLRRSHIYLNLPRHEAFSLSAAEALLAGKPAILSESVGLASYPEIAALAQVRIVPLRVGKAADAVVDCVRRLGELSDAAALSQAKIREFFSWERIAGSQLAMYGKVIAGTL